jgi:hypothetical protein
MSQRPSATGLLLCEQLLIDDGTKNVTPVNCFTRRVAENFPWTAPPFIALAWLIDGHGEVLLEVVVERSGTMDALYRRAEQFRLTSPLQQVRLSLRLQGITFPQPGSYRVLLRRRRFLLNDAAAPAEMFRRRGRRSFRPLRRPARPYPRRLPVSIVR